MSNSGEQLYNALDQARGIYVEIGRMLHDCDRLMEEHGWIAPKNETVSGISGSINHPERWMPLAVNRIYVNENKPNITKVVSVIVEDEWNQSLKEPVIVGSTYQTNEKKMTGFLSWDHTWWWFKLTSAESDGEITQVTATTSDTAEFKKAFSRFTAIELFGCPMADVTGTDTIKSLIITPLVES